MREELEGLGGAVLWDLCRNTDSILWTEGMDESLQAVAWTATLITGLTDYSTKWHKTKAIDICGLYPWRNYDKTSHRITAISVVKMFLGIFISLIKMAD